jgi:superfamily I DNA/RNA helicase
MDLNAIVGALNPEQLEAVKIKDGPVMVFAGAGTGKTKTLTSRVAYLIGYHNVNPQDILAITFTKKATQEMRDRLAVMLEHDVSWITITPCRTSKSWASFTSAGNMTWRLAKGVMGWFCTTRATLSRMQFASG